VAHAHNPTLERLRQEDWKFKISLNIARSCLKKKLIKGKPGLWIMVLECSPGKKTLKLNLEEQTWSGCRNCIEGTRTQPRDQSTVAEIQVIQKYRK
jgi:hypothetical protein